MQKNKPIVVDLSLAALAQDSPFLCIIHRRLRNSLAKSRNWEQVSQLPSIIHFENALFRAKIRRKMGRTRSGGPRLCAGWSEAETLSLRFKERFGTKKESLRLPPETFLFHCGRWDLNPHERNAHKILSLARLPVPTLPHSISRNDYISILWKKSQWFFLNL